MFGRRSGFVRTVLVSASAVLGAAALGLGDSEPGEPVRPAARVFVHPTPLTATDRLTDGLGGDVGKPIETEAGTVLVWIDRMPGARFDHPTEYVLISPKGTRVVPGNRRPVLNGKPVFQENEPTKVTIPVAVPKG